MKNIDSIKRNYFVIGSVLTFFVVGGATLYAKTGGDIQKVPQLLGIEHSISDPEQEVEIEHGVVSTLTKPHEGAGNDALSSGFEKEIEIEHGATTVTTKPHGGNDPEDDGEHRGRGRDDDDEDDTDDRWENGDLVVPAIPLPLPPVTPTPTQTKTFTLTEVATHKDAQSCYTTISGSVYDVTTYVPVHKGGPAAILAICGKDGSSLFAGQHAGAPKPEQMLASFKIGTLAQ